MAASEVCCCCCWRGTARRVTAQVRSSCCNHVVQMATHVKPGERYATSDWFTANYVISTDAERQRVASHETRQESHYLRNATFNRTKWDQYDNNTRLADRVDHIRKSVHH